MNLAGNHFKRAAVCSNGHLFSAMLEQNNVPSNPGYVPIPNFCHICGSPLHSDCPNCGNMINGIFYNTSVLYPSDYYLHFFCETCSKPFPWAGRDQIILNFQNVLLNEITDPALRLDLKELLAELLKTKDDDDKRRRIWDSITTKASKFLKSPLIETALKEVIKALFKSF